jgi:hypothetical protein
MSSPLVHRVQYKKTRKRVKAAPGPGEIVIRDLPLGVWKIPPRRWVLSLRRHDGMRDIRKVSGSVLDAHAARAVYMKTGNYAMAWLMEDDRPRGWVPRKKALP